MLGLGLRQVQEALNKKADEVQHQFVAVSDEMDTVGKKILEVRGDDRAQLRGEQDALRARQAALADEVNLWRERARAVTQQRGEASLRAYLEEAERYLCGPSYVQRNHRRKKFHRTVKASGDVVINEADEAASRGPDIAHNLFGRTHPVLVPVKLGHAAVIAIVRTAAGELDRKYRDAEMFQVDQVIAGNGQRLQVVEAIGPVSFLKPAGCCIAQHLCPDLLRLSQYEGICVFFGFIREKGRVKTAEDHFDPGIAKPFGNLVNPTTQYPVIDLMPDQRDIADLGGTMRLGSYPCRLIPNTSAARAYQAEEVTERHRHRFEFNNEYRAALQENGLVLSGLSPDGRLVEIAELKDHPFMLGSQFHPEFKSRPTRPHPLFAAFIEAARRKAGLLEG